MALLDGSGIVLAEDGHPDEGFVVVVDIETWVAQISDCGCEPGVCFHHLGRLFLDNECVENQRFKRLVYAQTELVHFLVARRGQNGRRRRQGVHGDHLIPQPPGDVGEELHPRLYTIQRVCLLLDTVVG